jgi:S-adenosylmethionine synthetase
MEATMKPDPLSPGEIRFAEFVLPGHPDRLADAIADAIVDAARERDLDALVGVEVAVHRDVVFVDGRVAGNGAEDLDAEQLVREVFEETGYGRWRPAPASLRVISDLCTGPLRDGERDVRGVSDDQSLVTGYACGDERTAFLPVEHFLALTLARQLDNLRRQHSSVLGPDGKALVGLSGVYDSPALHAVSLSIHHAEDADEVEVVRLARSAAEVWLKDVSRVFPSLAGTELGPDVLRVNGAGAFGVGGPWGDNGLSGKKLVVDFYGPSVPIGGGALCGKDPHKVDRCGAIRARQIAKHVVAAGLGQEALVRLAFLPGGTTPAHATIAVDGRPLDPSLERRWLTGYDLSVAGTHRDLGLGAVRFRPFSAWGPWSDSTLPWELWSLGPSRSEAK